jgi:hypothetical protein
MTTTFISLVAFTNAASLIVVALKYLNQHQGP